jgi:chromosome segregation ATPase
VSSLEILNGKAAGTVVDLETFAGKDKITLGNRRTASVVIKDPWVSFVHAVITRQGDQFLVADKRSKAGTFLNGSQISVQGTILSNGDVIRLGKTEVRFTASGGAAAPAAPAPGAAPAAAAPAAAGPFKASAPAPGSTGPFTKPAAAPAAEGAAGGASAAELERAKKDLEAMRRAVAEREKALAEAKAKIREREGGGGRPQQLERMLQETTNKAKIRIEELTRLNQTLEARLTQGGAGNTVAQEKEIARLRSEWRSLQEEARARFEKLSAERDLLKIELERAQAEGGGAASAEAVEQLENMKASFGQIQSEKMDLEIQVEDLTEELGKLKADLANAKPMGGAGSAEEIAALQKVIDELNAKLKAAQNTSGPATAAPAVAALQARVAELEGQLKTAQAAPAPAAGAGPAVAALQAKVSELEAKLQQAEAAAQAPAAAPAPAAPAGDDARAAALQAKVSELEAKLQQAEEAAAAAPAPAGGGGDHEARVKELEAENASLLKDLEEINEDMLAQEEEYMERIQELENQLAG